MEYKKYLTEQEKAYNKVCAMTFSQIYMLSKDSEVIAFKNVDLNNQEHLYVLHVAIGLGGAINKEIVAEGSKFFIARLNRKMGLKKECKIKPFNKNNPPLGMIPEMLNDELRKSAKELCGPLFTFGEIHDIVYLQNKPWFYNKKQDTIIA